MPHTVVAMPGDGIGKTVLPEAIRVLNAVKFDAEYIHADIGWEFWCKEGNALPQRTIDLLEKHKIGLFGAITSKPKDAAALEIDSSIKDKGFVYFSPIVGLRQHFNLDLCIRPCKSFPGNPLNFIIRDKEGFSEPEIDAVIFRQNTEGLYSGVEWTDPPKNVRDALETHPKMKKFNDVPGKDLAISTRIMSRGACRRIITEAFDYAKKLGFKNVTVCEKPNVLRETSGMMLLEAKIIAKDYPGIDLWDTNIDAQMMWLTKNPENYGVIVAENMFGDIISDGFAGLVGGLGFACSANIGKDVAVFEPTHGSAPKYQELNPSIVNPIAMILSACMMLDHIEENGKAESIRNAISKVIADGKVRTYDMLKLRGGPDVFSKGACTTQQLTDAIIAEL
ncbi:MAG TPA: isocitrate/isopropylmalate family dehydrogenase [Ignavibacteriaceae bacterium]|nr:isocitrate/isopropylmalate family dehydrogenase [Ignavibacteriaceae bacterium]